LKKILITGINGFIGSNCKTYFENKDFEVFGIDILGENKSNFIKGEVNIENLKSFTEIFDVIIHLAESGTVGAAQKNPESEYKKTVESTKNVLEYIKNFNPEAKLIYSSSAAVYGDLYDRPIKETDDLNPISIYGNHKIEAEKMCRDYYEKYGIKSNIIRFFSIYAEGLKKQLLWDFSNRVVENFSEKTLPCFGTGDETRDFIHISDAINLIELLINADKDFIMLNAGGNSCVKVSEVLNILSKELGYEGELVFDKIIRKGDPKSLIANIEIAQKLGFSPKVKYDEGMKNYVKWFKNN